MYVTSTNPSAREASGTQRSADAADVTGELEKDLLYCDTQVQVRYIPYQHRA